MDARPTLRARYVRVLVPPSDIVQRTAPDRAANTPDGPAWMLIQPLGSQYHPLHLTG